jgi:acyl carrier protein
LTNKKINIKKVENIILDYIEPDFEFDINFEFKNMGCDSMTMMDIILEIEDEFKVNITGETLEKIKSPKNLITFLEKNNLS